MFHRLQLFEDRVRISSYESKYLYTENPWTINRVVFEHLRSNTTPKYGTKVFNF